MKLREICDGRGARQTELKISNNMQQPRKTAGLVILTESVANLFGGCVRLRFVSWMFFMLWFS
jgi:hypothetical protein